MSATPSSATASAAGANAQHRRASFDALADRILFGLCVLASLLAAVTIALVGYKIADGAGLSFSKFGLGFLTQAALDEYIATRARETWRPIRTRLLPSLLEAAGARS